MRVSLGGVSLRSAYLHLGETLSQTDVSNGRYDIEVCMGRTRFPGGCRYEILVTH